MLLTNQMIQKTIQDMKQITGLECSVWTAAGDCLAMTAQTAKALQLSVQEFAACAVRDGNSAECVMGRGLFLVRDGDLPVYVLAVQGTSADITMTGRFGVSQLTSLLNVYKEKMDKNRFMQNLILGNLLPADIYSQARKMKIPIEQRRAVYLVEPKNEGDNLILETLKGLYGAGTKDFVTSVGEGRAILVKALDGADSTEKIRHTARMLVDTLNMEAMIGIRIAYGTVSEELKDIPRIYREAEMALEVGRVFYGERNILTYSGLGIGRLIHQLPKALCEIFLKEVFDGSARKKFEDDELAAVYTFFDNNLNISETARQLYVHRNTLVYRLEKIQKKTGLDVRVFDDALTFKIAMMVEMHMKYLQELA